MNEITYELTKEFGVLSESATGWKKELNAVRWNGREAKFDLREWSPGRQKMGKGITLNRAEVAELKKLLQSMNL